jgi:glycosyltransferase involved in cell wall biosynthesis
VDSVKEDSYPNKEILVIDAGLERSLQRNIGIRNSKGEYLLFLDSDTEISGNLISECVEYMKWVDAVYIPEVIVTPGFFGYLRNWERQFYTGSLVDVVRFVKAENCPLFDETMSGPEDSDFDRQVKGERETIKQGCILHYDDVGIIKYFKKKAYYSRSMSQFEKKNPGDKVLDFKYRCWTVFTESGKWKKLLQSPHLTLCLIGLVFIRGIIYLWRKH